MVRSSNRSANCFLYGVWVKETVEVVLVPRVRVQWRTVDAPMLQVLEETVEVVRLVPHKRVQQRTAEQIVHVPHFLEETVGVSAVDRRADGGGSSGARSRTNRSAGGNRGSCASHTSRTNRGAESGYPSASDAGNFGKLYQSRHVSAIKNIALNRLWIFWCLW